MVKRALTSYDTVCWPDRLSFAQEMRKSQKYASVDIFLAMRLLVPFTIPFHSHSTCDSYSLHSGSKSNWASVLLPECPRHKIMREFLPSTSIQQL